MTESFFVRLKNRGLVHVEGPDSLAFLQGLITNDIRALAPGKALYACLLTPQGKFLFDMFITQGAGFYLLECEGGDRAQELYKKLLMYRLRADVRISVEEDRPVYSILSSRAKGQSPEAEGSLKIPPCAALSRDDNWVMDPRHPDMGFRSFEKPAGIPEKPFAAWDRRRISLCIPDGSRDLTVGVSTMDEGRMDRLNAVSYDKGCYIGQEVTARMKYRGLGKRHLQVVEIIDNHSLKILETNIPRHCEELATKQSSAALKSSGLLRCARNDDLTQLSKIFSQDGSLIGEMRSSCGDIGLALVK